MSRATLRKLLASHNPFYVISAVLVLYGISTLVEGLTRDVAPWTFLGALGGYGLLLTGAAVIIIRRAGAWDDARSVMLLLALMHIAMTTAIEDIAWTDPVHGLLAGLMTSLVVILMSAGIFAGTRLRLPRGTRWLWVAWVFTFALLPVLSPIVGLDAHPGNVTGPSLLVLGAPCLAGLLLALGGWAGGRPGQSFGEAPWRWPICPHSLFVLMGIGAVLRVRWLSMSSVGLSSRAEAFGPWLLIPIVLGAAVLLLRLGVMSRRRSWIEGSVILSMLMVILSPGAPSAPSNETLVHAWLTGHVGSLLHMSLILAALFGVAALAAGSRLAIVLIGGNLAALVVVGPDFIDTGDLSLRTPVAAVLMVGLVLLHLVRRRLLTALALTVTIPAVALFVGELSVTSLFIAGHLLAGGLILTGILMPGKATRYLLATGGIGLTLVFLGHLSDPLSTIPGMIGSWVYSLALPLGLLALSWRLDDPALRWQAVISLTCTGWRTLSATWDWLGTLNIPDGTWPTVIGLITLLLAVGVSLSKGRMTHEPG